jgi:hypothetical protein
LGSSEWVELGQFPAIVRSFIIEGEWKMLGVRGINLDLTTNGRTGHMQKKNTDDPNNQTIISRFKMYLSWSMLSRAHCA